MPQFNHGTTVMSAAGGKTYGASKKATLHMIKIDHRAASVGKVNRRVPTHVDETGKTAEEIEREIRKAQAKDTVSQQPQFGLDQVIEAFQLVIATVKGKKALVGQAVVNFSIGENSFSPSRLLKCSHLLRLSA